MPETAWVEPFLTLKPFAVISMPSEFFHRFAAVKEFNLGYARARLLYRGDIEGVKLFYLPVGQRVRMKQQLYRVGGRAEGNVPEPRDNLIHINSFFRFNHSFFQRYFPADFLTGRELPLTHRRKTAKTQYDYPAIKRKIAVSGEKIHIKTA